MENQILEDICKKASHPIPSSPMIVLEQYADLFVPVVFWSQSQNETAALTDMHTGWARDTESDRAEPLVGMEGWRLQVASRHDHNPFVQV